MKFKKRKIQEIVPIIVLLWFSISGMFNGITVLFLGTSFTILIDTFFVFMLFFFSKKTRDLKINEVIFASFYLSLSFTFLCYYIFNNHYGFTKIFNNFVLTSISMFNYANLYRFFKEEKLLGNIKKVFTIQIIIQLIMFAIYLLYNKRNGLIGVTPVQIFLLQDWDGRFQGTFSEPSFMGVWLGMCVFCSPLVFKRMGKLLSCIFLYILYFSCGAKFALLAIPLVFIISPIVKYLKKDVSLLFIQVIFILIIFISLFWDNAILYFFNLLKSFLHGETSATYSTRFGFLFSTIDKIVNFPVGQGIGMNYEYYQNLIYDFAPKIQGIGFETWEILGYKTDPICLGPKDTFSVIGSSFGLLGLFLYFSLYFNLLSRKYYHKRLVGMLILFCFIESIISVTIFSGAGFFIFLFARMAINNDMVSEETYEKNSICWANNR